MSSCSSSLPHSASSSNSSYPSLPQPSPSMRTSSNSPSRCCQIFSLEIHSHLSPQKQSHPFCQDQRQIPLNPKQPKLKHKLKQRIIEDRSRKLSILKRNIFLKDSRDKKQLLLKIAKLRRERTSRRKLENKGRMF